MKSLNQQVHEARGMCWHESMNDYSSGGSRRWYKCSCGFEFPNDDYIKHLQRDNPNYEHSIADAWGLFEEGKDDDKFIIAIAKIVYHEHHNMLSSVQRWKDLSVKDILKHLNGRLISKAYLTWKGRKGK